MKHLTSLPKHYHRHSSLNSFIFNFRTGVVGVHFMYLLVPVHCAMYALIKRYLGFVSQKAMRFLNISACVWHIPWLVRHYPDHRFFPYMLLHNTNELLERCATTFPEVEDFIWMGPVDRTDNTIYDIINVGVVAAGGAVPELLDFNATTHSVNKFEWCHIRPTAWPIHSEESKSRDVYLI